MNSNEHNLSKMRDKNRMAGPGPDHTVLRNWCIAGVG